MNGFTATMARERLMANPFRTNGAAQKLLKRTTEDAEKGQKGAKRTKERDKVLFLLSFLCVLCGSFFFSPAAQHQKDAKGSGASGLAALEKMLDFIGAGSGAGGTVGQDEHDVFGRFPGCRPWRAP